MSSDRMLVNVGPQYSFKARKARGSEINLALEPFLSPIGHLDLPSGRINPSITLEQTARYLNVSSPQVYSLVRSGELPAIKLGGRGVWRRIDPLVKADVYVIPAVAVCESSRIDDVIEGGADLARMQLVRKLIQKQRNLSRVEVQRRDIDAIHCINVGRSSEVEVEGRQRISKDMEPR